MSTHSEDGRDNQPEVVAWFYPNPDGSLCMDAVRDNPDYPGAVAVMTVAQHKRIVAAKDAAHRVTLDELHALEVTVAKAGQELDTKDAEIARLRELHENAHSAAKTLMAERATLMEQAAHWLEVNAPSGGCIETNIADELRAEAEQLRAQPARQVGSEKRSAGDAWLWHALRSQYGDESQAEEGFYAGWKAHATLAPAAVAVVLPTVDQVMKVVMRYQWEDKANVTGTTNWAANLGMAVVNEVARLNRRAIPVGLLERIDRALEHARMFIQNGVALGFIRMPDNDTPDPAKDTLPTVEAAQNELRALLGKGGDV